MSDTVQVCACVFSFTLCDNPVKSLSHHFIDPFTCQKKKNEVHIILPSIVFVTVDAMKMKMEVVSAYGTYAERSQVKGQLQCILWVL